jgi:osmoprotectant transport system ATP-binding protein
MAAAAVEFRGVSFAGPGAPPRLEDLDLSVSSGELLVLLGRSGSGKTTTLKLINRLLTPSRGEVLVDGKTTTEWTATELRRRIGYVIQEGGLFPHFDVARNVGLVPSLLGWDAARVTVRVREMLELVGLDPRSFADRYPDELSGGERQRVGVARALAGDPPLLLMDEPFGALDPPTRTEIRTEFAALARRLGKTIVFVTHDLHEALSFADRIALLARSRLTFLGGAQELLESSEPEARAFARTLPHRLQ